MFINTETQKTLGRSALGKLFPNTSLPTVGPDHKWLADKGYAVFKILSAPTVTNTEVAEEVGTELVKGVWQTKWEVRDKTLEERTSDWQRLMKNTDREMSRSLEDVIDVLTQEQKDNLAAQTMFRYDDKKALRAEKPV